MELTIVSTVQPPTPSYSLVDLATVKALLGVTGGKDDAYFKAIIPQASAAAAQYAENPFVVETITDKVLFDDSHAAWGVLPRIGTLQLSRWPVISVASVVETTGSEPTVLVEGVNFIVDGRSGRLIRTTHEGLSRAWSSYPTTVTFAAGYETIPADVTDAVVRLIKAQYYARNRDPLLRQSNATGVYEETFFFGTGPGASGNMPPDVAAILDNYRVPVIG